MKIYLLKDRPGYRGIPLMAFSTKQGSGAVAHTHDFVEIVLIREGHTIHSWYDKDGRKHARTVIKGDVYGIMPGEVHEYIDNHNLKTFNLAFMPDIFGAESGFLETMPCYHDLFNREHLRLYPQHFSLAEKLFLSIMRELRQSNGADHHYLLAKSRLIEFVNIIAGEPGIRNSGIADPPDERIIRAAKVMEDHICDGISIPELAKRAGLCYSMFTARFKNLYGIPPQEYQILLRLEYACKLLEDTTLSVGEIAFQCGFYDSNHLLKHFQRHYKQTPKQYRNQLKN